MAQRLKLIIKTKQRIILMGKQQKTLKSIIRHYELFSQSPIKGNQKEFVYQMRIAFKRSLNKSDIVRKILNECVLSETEIIEVLKILFSKEKDIKK